MDETSADSKDTFASGAWFSPPSYLSSKKKKQRGKKKRKAKGKGPTEADQTKKKRKSEGQRTWLELWPVNSGPGGRWFKSIRPDQLFLQSLTYATCDPYLQILAKFLGGNKGALRIPLVSFQSLRRPGGAAKLLCFQTIGGFDPHRPYQLSSSQIRTCQICAWAEVGNEKETFSGRLIV